MDLSSMLNDGEAPPPAKKSSTPSQTSPPPSSRGSAPQSTPGSAQNGAYPGGGAGYGYGQPRPGQATPLYGPPSASIGPPGQPQSRGLTPLHTPSHAPAGGQYPFPQQQQQQQQFAQSPVSAHPGHPPQQQYRPYDGHSATTPGARPSSHGLAQPSPSVGQFSRPHNAHPSLSPTPPSHHSQTPHSMRQSPMAAMGHPPPQQPPPHYYHSSQPSTPLGPPQLPQRHSNSQVDMTSPYHSRTFSGTSTGMIMNSPAHHNQSTGQSIASPTAYSRPSPQQRRTSDQYRTSLDQPREKSESVSPKSHPRPPSLGSRHSSQQEVYSARSSFQHGASVAPQSVTPTHVQPPTPSYPHPQPQQAHPSREVSQGPSQTSSSWPAQSENGDALSQPDNKIPLQHQHQKMPMSHLLAPTSHVQHATPNGGLPQAAPSRLDTAHPQHYSRPSPAPSAVSSQSHEQPQANIKQEQPLTPASSVHQNSQSQSDGLSGHRLSHHRSSDMSASEATEARPPLKRSADPEALVEPPTKRGRSRKYRERPIWAHLHPSNPRSREPGVAPNSREVSAPAQRHQPPPSSHANAKVDNSQPTQQSNGQPRPQTNGTGAKPWLQDPPLDEELILARQILGIPWERTIKWDKPVSGINRAVADWLFLNFQHNADIGRDARVGTIEIEAKLGTLLNDRNERVRLPVQNACVLQPDFPVTFLSSMNASEHKHMNEFLNDVTLASNEPGRQKLHYKHTRETDTFRPLSKAGYDLLPEAAFRNAWRPRGRDLSLRTSTNNADGSVVARIVKVKIANDLHIYGAGDPYDVRISMNLEVNFMGKDIDPGALTNDANSNKNKPSRSKDRMSYKHLNNTFAIDLTRVDSPGMDPIYELELELDANVARDQSARLEQRQQSAYMPVVEGFVDNLTHLMKRARGPAA